MDDLESLELLSLVSKVTSELQNHVGISDKTLAEFVIAQRLDCRGLDDFKEKLAAVGANFPPSLIESVDRLVRALHPKLKGQAQNGSGEGERPERSVEEKAHVIRGLAIPDKDVEYEEWHPRRQGDRCDSTTPSPCLRIWKAKRSGRRPRGRESRSPNDDRSGDRPRRRERHRSRSRSRSRDRRKGRHDDDPGPLGTARGTGGSGRTTTTPKTTVCDGAQTPSLDDEPILYKVYEGHVTGVIDFGAFVNLHGIQGKVDGLVHVSALVEGQRVSSPADLLSRGQSVKVKVVR